MNRVAAQVHGWLLLLPAAVLLAAFTHYPAVATLWNSFYSTAKPNRYTSRCGCRNECRDLSVLQNHAKFMLLRRVCVFPQPSGYSP